MIPVLAAQVSVPGKQQGEKMSPDRFFDSIKHARGWLVLVFLVSFMLSGCQTMGRHDSVPSAMNDCEELRLACEQKNRLGEQGQGNCRRYREECGNPQDYCQNLQWRCMHKEETGEAGKGICRKYRDECGRSVPFKVDS